MCVCVCVCEPLCVCVCVCVTVLARSVVYVYLTEGEYAREAFCMCEPLSLFLSLPPSLPLCVNVSKYMDHDPSRGRVSPCRHRTVKLSQVGRHQRPCGHNDLLMLGRVRGGWPFTVCGSRLAFAVTVRDPNRSL